MTDAETKSHWSHILGEAMSGSLRGAQLEALPAVMTDWDRWRRDHPNTTVLNMPRTAQEFRRDFYKDPARFVLGMAGGGKARAWPFDWLVNQPVVNDHFDGEPILLAFDKPTGGGYSYSRRLDEETLEFGLDDGKLVDKQTRSRWDPSSGRAVEGPLAGKQLRPVVAIISFRQAWEAFHPESAYWKPE